MSIQSPTRRWMKGFTILGCLATCSLAGFVVERAPAQDARYESVTPDHTMKEWLLLGPIPAQDADEKANAENARKFGYTPDLLEKSGGEAKVSATIEKKLAARGGEYEWRSHESSSDVVDLIKALGQHDFAVGYAAATIESPEDKTHLVGLGSDDAVRVWLNGELVHENPAPRAVRPDDDIFPIKLKKGANNLLIKVLNDQGGWGFTFRVLSPESLAERLFKAASEGETETVAQLLSSGIDLNARSAAGITAAQIAKARGHEELVELLVSKGAESPQPFDAKSVLTKMLDETSPDDAPGIAVLVARDGKVIYGHGFGLSDLANDVQITPQTKFRIGSITKQVGSPGTELEFAL